MKLKVFTFRFSESTDGFDDKPMQDFIVDKEVIEFTEHFFIHEKTPYLTVLLSFRDLPPDERRKRHRGKDPRKELDQRERNIYDALRTWRATRAKQEGIPAYMIANNRQLAEMIKSGIKSKADLSAVRGIGEAKVTQYGEEILDTMAQFPHGPADAGDAPK